MFQLKEAALRLKEIIIGGSVEKSLEDATANTDNLNVPTRILTDIADRSYNTEEYEVIIKHIWQQLGASADKWRRITKTLNLVEFLIKNGSPRFVIDLREEIYRIRMLIQFTHKENGEDKSASIVETSVRLDELLSSDEMIDQERRKADVLRVRLKNFSNGSKNNECSSGGARYDGFSSKDADLFLKMSSRESKGNTIETEESPEKVPENYVRDGDYVMRKHGVYNIDLTEDPPSPTEVPQEVNLLDIDLLPTAESMPREEGGLRDISNLSLNKAKSAKAQIWEWDQQVYNKYANNEEKNGEEFDWSKAPQNSMHFANEIPAMYNRSVSLPETGNQAGYLNNENEISLI